MRDDGGIEEPKFGFCAEEIILNSLFGGACDLPEVHKQAGTIPVLPPGNVPNQST